MVFDDKILAATSDGLYQRDVSEIPTEIESSDGNIPQAFSLSQNYPNPFNPSTTISYSISIPAHVSIKVYDILGQEVCTLVDEDKKTGNYIVVFDASALAGGVYYYQLKTGIITVARRATLLK